MSAQKALQGSETETRELLGGTEEKQGLLDFSQKKGNIINLSWWPDLAATEADVEAAVTEDEDRDTLVEVDEEANTPHSNRHAH